MNLRHDKKFIELVKYLNSLTPEQRENFWRKAGLKEEAQWLYSEEVTNLIKKETPIVDELIAALPDHLKPSS